MTTPRNPVKTMTKKELALTLSSRCKIPANVARVAVNEAVAEMVARIRTYIPGYQLILEPILESGRLVAMVRVEGLGDYLPRYAGNLDIINCAAIAFAEGCARQWSGQT